MENLGRGTTAYLVQVENLLLLYGNYNSTRLGHKVSHWSTNLPVWIYSVSLQALCKEYDIENSDVHLDFLHS